MDIAQFRIDFPEFADTARYTTAQITFWSTFATSQISVDRWGDTAPYAVQLYTAHEITLANQSDQASQAGGVPGSSGGIASSKTVGSVSVSYDSTVTSEQGAGYWNLTIYGKQYYRLLKMYGSGCVQL